MSFFLPKPAFELSPAPARTIVEIEFTDQPDHKRHWRYLNEAGKCELCLKRPDRDADLYVLVTLPDLILIWRGDLKLPKALEHGRIEVVGSARLRRAFRDWLGPTDYAD